MEYKIPNKVDKDLRTEVQRRFNTGGCQTEFDANNSPLAQSRFKII